MLFIFWILLSFLVAFIGKGKRIGYWGVFIISLLLSPLVGIIVGLVSGNKIVPIKETLNQILDKAEKAKFRGDNEEAVKLFMDAKYYISKNITNTSRELKDFYTRKELEIESELSKLKS